MSDRNDPTLQRFTTTETVKSDSGRTLAEIERLPTATLTQPGESGDFELGPALGHGGMGEVHEARQVAMQRVVAVKRPLKTADTAGLLLEAVATGRLEHPGIVPVHLLAHAADQTPFFVMKRIEGRPWSELLRTQTLEEQLEILLRVCDAVAFAHGQHVVHRDIKPANVMIGTFGEVYLVDWGLAAATEPDPVLPSTDDVPLGGTPAYMAPEMATAGRIGPWSDVYLLGATLCELLTGNAPHGGKSIVDAMAQAAAGTLPELEGVSPDLAHVCRRAMAFAPRDRFASVQELRASLLQSVRHRGALALHEQTMQRLAALERGEQVAGLFVECRFGFEEVRRQWPDFEPAREGLRRTIIAMIRHELGQGSVQSARALLAGLERPPGELVAALEAAELAARARTIRLEQLEHKEREGSSDAARASKARFVVLFAPATALFSFSLQAVMWKRPEWLTSRAGVGLVMVFGISSALYDRTVRGAPDTNSLQKRLVRALTVTWLLSLVLWCYAAWWDLPFMQGVALYDLINAAGWTVGLTLIDDRGWPIALAFFLGSIFSVLVPSIAMGISGVLIAGGFLLVGHLLSKPMAATPGPS
jgi:serine/threonine-protein kinase